MQGRGAIGSRGSVYPPTFCQLFRLRPPTFRYHPRPLSALRVLPMSTTVYMSLTAIRACSRLIMLITPEVAAFVFRPLPFQRGNGFFVWPTPTRRRHSTTLPVCTSLFVIVVITVVLVCSLVSLVFVTLLFILRDGIEVARISSEMASHLPIYSKYVYQWRVSQVVLVYGLHRLEVWRCGAAESADVNRPAELHHGSRRGVIGTLPNFSWS